MKSLDDKVVVITGAASGIGRALAVETAGKGAHVAICDVDEVGLAPRRQDSWSTPVHAPYAATAST
jgi:NAD(P)-dependent dehydrogenase (short-subunit alcohol dehydrogenase family)